MWEAIVSDEELKKKVSKKLEEITGAITNNYSAVSEIGLMDGKAGISVFYSYLNKLNNSNKHENTINSILTGIFSHLNSNVFIPTHCSGMSGVMWCIDHLTTEGVIEYENDDQDIHDYLEEQSLIYANDNNFDFLHGANGLALYLLRKESNLHLFNEIIELLFSKGIIHDDTIKWESVVNFDSRRKGYNLSLSHGISSIIIILSKFIEKYPNHKRAIELVNLSINYLLSKKNHPTLSSLYKFPSYIDSEYDDEQARIQSRLGWCYGDMGNAVALYTAGQVLKNHNLIDEALEIMLHSTKNKDLNAAGAKDAGLCHGTAGISHIFNRFYQCTGKLEFKNAALYWLERTLEMATFEDGFAGYKTFQGQETWKSELSFLDGVAGIGLVLMSTISDVEPKWDNCLLLS